MTKGPARVWEERTISQATGDLIGFVQKPRLPSPAVTIEYQNDPDCGLTAGWAKAAINTRKTPHTNGISTIY